jgi:hypothetical protein
MRYTGKQLKEWCLEMFDKNLPKLEPIADTSFASDEAMEESLEPNDNTKMIT